MAPMTTETTDPSLPVYYAYKCVRGHDGVVSYLIASPDIRFVKIHGFSQPIVTLRIRERRDGDPPSGYFGWLATDRPGEYQHVWPSEGQLEMCWTGLRACCAACASDPSGCQQPRR